MRNARNVSGTKVKMSGSEKKCTGIHAVFPS